ncbi:MAG: cytochrome c [Cycloclasticus sp.]|nr:cytochrome c [Cycloclasticus sp.]MBQ0789027.1 cytochrome c [Cycloclasticus sp.]
MNKLLIIGLSCLALSACDQATDNKTESTNQAASLETNTPVQQTTAIESSNRAGRVIFELHCAGCHDPGPAHAATKQLALVRGEDNAVIMQRKDLTTDYIKYIVRDGLLEMPPFRPTDINAAELDNLARYIVDSANTYTPEETQ